MAYKQGQSSTKPVVLHLFGSSASEYYEGVSVVYATECLNTVVPQGTYLNVACRVHFDGSWSFPADMTEEGLAKADRVPINEAIRKICELNPHAVVPHMFCLDGMVAFRSFVDVMKIPLVGNPGPVMSLSTNKWQTKAVVGSQGVKVPEAEMLYKGQLPQMKPPFLVKPCNEDNSQGISLVKEGMNVQKALDEAFQFDYEVLIERYVPLGRELRVAVLEMEDGSLEMLPCIEYFLSEAAPIRTPAMKLQTNEKGVPVSWATTDRKCPADIDDVLKEKLRDMAVRSHKALGCQYYSLYDVRVDPQGEPYFIEACLYCSFAPKSVIVLMANEAGKDQRAVYEMLVNRAIKKKTAISSEAATFGMRAK